MGRERARVQADNANIVNWRNFGCCLIQKRGNGGGKLCMLKVHVEISKLKLYTVSRILAGALLNAKLSF